MLNRINYHLKEFCKCYKGRTVLILILLALICLTYECFFWHINLQNIKFPLVYSSGDDFTVYLDAINIMDMGWVFSSERLAAPFGVDFYDFPPMFLHNVDLLILKGLLAFVKNPFIAVNIEYIIIPLITSFIAFFVLRELQISNWLSVCASVTYSFLPYYFLRNVQHLVLATYQFVPLAFLLCIWLYHGEIFNSLDRKKMIANSKNRWTLFFCVCIANSGIGYYAVFTCFFVIITAGMLLAEYRSIKKAFPSIIVICVITMFFLLNLLPLMFVNIGRGTNPEIAKRLSIESDIYGLKISQMIVPYYWPIHGSLEDAARQYHDNAPLVNENKMAYIGLMATIGFFILLWNLFSLNGVNNREIRLFSKLNIAAVLLATIGGFGTVMAIITNPFIRGYNRISVFIAFISIATFCIMIQKKLSESKHNILGMFLIFLLSLFGLVMQFPHNTPNYINIRAQYLNDKEFIQKIEQLMPKAAMIYYNGTMN